MLENSSFSAKFMLSASVQDCVMTSFFLPVEGDDFSVPDPTELDVFFASGSVNGDMDCINISILDDGALEGDHSFTVSLNPPAAPVTLTTPSSSPVIITDNEGTI